MTLVQAVQVAQVFAVVLVFPTTIWKAWLSFDKRIDEMDKRTMRIEAQFFKNGGSSLKDDINLIKEVQANIKGHLGL